MKDSKLILRWSKKTIKWVTKKTQEKCNEWVRAIAIHRQDGCCISCGNRLGEIFHAGHFFSVGSSPGVRYDSDNIWGQ